MTNSEIKKCPYCRGKARIEEHYTKINNSPLDKSNSVCVRCTECCAMGSRYYIAEEKDREIFIEYAIKAWNTRTPESTKADNGLVPLAENAVADFMFGIYYPEKSLPENYNTKSPYYCVAKSLCQVFGTPSITKEQLLAILPKLRNPILHDDPSDFRERNEQFTYSSSVESFNFAVLQIKQRIEELFKPATLNDRGRK